MKIIRKKGVDKIKIEHNSKLLWIIVLLIIALIILIYFIIQNKPNQVANNNSNVNNDKNIKCAPATCCHANECVLSEQAPDCSKAICSMVCSGPLDCGAGHCEFINNKCGVVPED
jgi:hypothetical protein